MPATSRTPQAPEPLASGSKGIPMSLVMLIASVVLCIGIVGGVMLRGDGKAASDNRPGKGPVRPPSGVRPPREGPLAPGVAEAASEANDPAAGPRNPATTRVAVPANLKTPEEMLDILRQAIHANDVDAMNAIDAMLKQYVNGDPARAREVMELFKHETEPSILEIMAGALLADPQIANAPEMVQGFLAIARDDRNSDRRGQALLFLSGVTEVSPELVNEVVNLARTETDMQVRIGSIAALTQYLQGHKEFSAQINDTFLEIARTDKDETVRGSAVQALDVRDASPQSLDAVSQVLRADQAAGVRAVAAMMMGDVHPQQRQYAMTQLEESFTREQDREVKRSMITSVVRAGREEALATLERMRSADPKYQDDINDYVEILRTGERDMDKIWDLKFQREQARGEVNTGDDHDDHSPDGGDIPPDGAAPPPGEPPR